MVPYQGQQIDLTPPWRRVSMRDIVRETCGVDFYPFMLSGDLEGARQAAVEHARIAPEALQTLQSAGEVLNFVFEERCEATLIQPTFITDHPVEVSPLAKPHRSQKGLVERFEMFMVEREHANAFSELTDPIDQRARFNVQVRGPRLACCLGWVAWCWSWPYTPGAVFMLSLRTYQCVSSAGGNLRTYDTHNISTLLSAV